MERPNFIRQHKYIFKKKDDGKLMKWEIRVRKRERHMRCFIGKLWTNKAQATLL